MLARRCVFAAALIWTGNAVAQDDPALKPPPALLSSQIEAELPLYWESETLNVVAEVNNGDAVDPRWRMRFEVQTSPVSALYKPAPDASGSLEPFLVLIETLPAAASRTVYGTATATYSAGSWTLDVTLENVPGQLGRPVDLFDQPTVVAGTETLDAVKSKILKAGKVGSEIATERARRQAAIEQEISALERRRTEALQQLEEAHANALARIEAQQETAMTELDAASRSLLNGIKADLEALEGEKSRAVAEARKLAEETITEVQRTLRETGKESRDAVLAAQTEVQNMHADLMTEIQTQRSALETDLAEAHARLEEAAEGSLKAIRIETRTEAFAAEAEALAALTEAEEARGKRLAALEAARTKTIRDAAAARKASLEALRETLESDDAMVRRTALREAFASGNPVLQQAAFTAMIADHTRLPFRWRDLEPADADNAEWTHRTLEFIWLADATGNFKIRYEGPDVNIVDEGSITGGRIQSGLDECIFTLTFTETGEELSGKMTCKDTIYEARVALM